jgi:general secretion pathway protein A
MNIYAGLRLEREPFSTSPDPRFFYKSSDHSRALHRLEISIRLRRGMSLILGEVGTGKTTLSRALFQAFTGEEPRYVFHMILDPSYRTELEFLTHLTRLFGINPFFRSRVDHREAIERYLFRLCVEEKKSVVLVIDEGQKLDLPQLEILRTLLNYETNDYKMLQLVILAQMELFPRLKGIHNFMDRVSFKCILKPMNVAETANLIEYRLHQAGYRGVEALFTPDAIRQIHAFTGGYPRQIARLCHNALEHLMMTEGRQVDADVIKTVVEHEQIWQ